MSRYIDPICYSFFFSTILKKEDEGYLRQVFLQTLHECKAWLLQEGNLGAEVPLDLISIHGRNLLGHHWFTFQNKSIKDLDIDACDGIMQREDCSMLELCDEPKANLHFSSPAGKSGKKCERLLKKTKKDQIDSTYIQELSEMLSCPSDSLDDVRVPVTMVRGTSLFIIEWRRWPVIYHESEYIGMTPDFSPSPYELQELMIRIPRYLIGDQVSVLAMQNKWQQKLISLGERYACSMGSIMMDTPATQGWGAFSCYDDGVDYDQRWHYPSQIPGYCWGMLINAAQKEKLPTDQNEGFHCVKDLANGNRYYQLTEDMRCINREQGTFLRNFFKQSLPTDPLGVCWDGIPPSYRLCFSPEDVSTENLRHLELVQIRI